MTTANEKLLDRMISHEIGLRRLEAGTLREIVSLLNKVDVRLTTEIILGLLTTRFDSELAKLAFTLAHSAL